MSPAATLVEALEPLRSDPGHAAVLLDIDGTLAPIVRHADDAHVPEATRTLLIEIARRYRLVGCISGRRAATARQIVAIGSIAYVGNHGAELLLPGATRPELDPAMSAWTERVRTFASRAFTNELQRMRIRHEDKQAIAAFHWRGAPDEERAERAVRAVAHEAEEAGLAVHWGRKVLEIRPPVTVDKGDGIAALLGAGRGRMAEAGAGEAATEERGTATEGEAPGRGVRVALYAGDDTTDLDAFRCLRTLTESGFLDRAVCVGVSSDEAPAELAAEADITIDGVNGVRGLLEALL